MTAGEGSHPKTSPPSATVLNFGFLPIVSPGHLVKRFSPLTEYLSQTLGLEVRLVTAPDFATFVRRTDEGRYDLLFTAPHLYYLAHRDAGYRVLARVARDSMQAVIVAPKNGGVRTLADLAGHRLATTDPLALATVLVRERLLRAGLEPDHDLTLVPTPSHNASLLSTHQGVTDAAALMLPLFHHSDPSIQDNMRIVAYTRKVPHMPISVAPWVDAGLAARVRDSLFALARSAAGARVLERLGWPGLVAADEQIYADLAWTISSGTATPGAQ